MNKALGLIEIRGLATAVTVLDVMVKAACVELVNVEKTNGNGWIIIKVCGDVAAVNASVSAGKRIGETYNAYVSSKVIPRPVTDVVKTFCKEIANDSPKPAPTDEPTPEAVPTREMAPTWEMAPAAEVAPMSEAAPTPEEASASEAAPMSEGAPASEAAPTPEEAPTSETTATPEIEIGKQPAKKKATKERDKQPSDQIGAENGNLR